MKKEKGRVQGMAEQKEYNVGFVFDYEAEVYPTVEIKAKSENRIEEEIEKLTSLAVDELVHFIKGIKGVSIEDGVDIKKELEDKIYGVTIKENK